MTVLRRTCIALAITVLVRPAFVSAQVGNGGDIRFFDCATKRFELSATTAAAEALDANDGPAGVVGSVVRLDHAGQGEPFFGKGADAFLRRYFTRSFKASWDHAMAQPGDVLDGDPITGLQAVTSIKLLGTETTSQTSDTATVVATLIVTMGGDKPQTQSVRLLAKREGATWKIDDISGPVDGSLRGYLKKSTVGRGRTIDRRHKKARPFSRAS